MKVSQSGRYLTDDDGKPFFYLADTAWRLLYELDRDETVEYLTNRRQKGFNVIMPVILAEIKDEERGDNQYGYKPLNGNDPGKPCEEFFQHVDFVVDTANKMGFCVALLPTWGEYAGPLMWGKGPVIFNETNAHIYGKYIGERYGDKNVIWVLGGDRRPEKEEYAAIWRAMAAGLKEGDKGRNLMTYHPSPDFDNDRISSSEWLHEEPWLDFNMMQTSTRWDLPNYKYIIRDYQKTPVKPTVDGEARYEHSHEFFWENPVAGRRITAHQVRKAAYNAVLSGALGHTYGCRDVWSFYRPCRDKKPQREVSLDWRRAMDLPGAFEMGYMKKLFCDYPWYRLMPQQAEALLVHSWREGAVHMPCAISTERDSALVYVPENMPVYIKTEALSGKNIKAAWFNPRNGQYIHAGSYTNQSILEFTPLTEDKDPDYVLVLEAK